MAGVEEVGKGSRSKRGKRKLRWRGGGSGGFFALVVYCEWLTMWVDAAFSVVWRVQVALQDMGAFCVQIRRYTVRIDLSSL